jgi:hypothetical protein
MSKMDASSTSPHNQQLNASRSRFSHASNSKTPERLKNKLPSSIQYSAEKSPLLPSEPSHMHPTTKSQTLNPTELSQNTQNMERFLKKLHQKRGSHSKDLVLPEIKNLKLTRRPDAEHLIKKFKMGNASSAARIGIGKDSLIPIYTKKCEEDKAIVMLKSPHTRPARQPHTNRYVTASMQQEANLRAQLNSFQIGKKTVTMLKQRIKNKPVSPNPFLHWQKKQHAFPFKNMSKPNPHQLNIPIYVHK